MKTTIRPRRTGVVLLCVLACLLVSLSLVVSALQMSLQARRESKTTRQLRQTELLIDAGVLRAERQLRSSENYAGEIWELDQAVGFEHASIEIVVSNPVEDAEVTTEALNPAAENKGQTLQTSHSDVEPLPIDNGPLSVTVTASIWFDSSPKMRTQQTHIFTVYHSEPSQAESL